MTNQLDNYVPEIAGRGAPRCGPDVSALAGQSGEEGILSNQLAADSSWYHRRFHNGITGRSKTSLEQEYAPLSEQVCHERVVLLFCAKPGDTPVKIDLLSYMQLGLAKESRSFLSKSETGKSSIRQIGERFHNCPMLSLRDAWLRWRRLELRSQA